MNSSGCLLVSWSFTDDKDGDVLIVGKRDGTGTTIVNAFQGEEARALYERLVKGERRREMHIAWRILIGLIPACCYIAVVSNAHRRLKNEIEQKDREIKQLKYDLKSYECQIDTIMNVDNSIPEGCMQGPYCEACAFVKHYYVPSNQPGIGRRLLTLCGKGMACDCFVEKGEEK